VARTSGDVLEDPVSVSLCSTRRLRSADPKRSTFGHPQSAIPSRMFIGHCVADPQATIVVTDGNGLLGLTVDAVRIMQIPQLLPPLLVVGLGYPGARTVSDATELGSRDLTPTAWVRRCGKVATASAAASGSGKYFPGTRTAPTSWP
jgi:hypothetical protein